MVFEHEISVRFHHVDRAGIAFFGRTFEYCHDVFEEMLRAGGEPLEGIFERRGWGMPLVHAEADFSRPLQMGERLRVCVSVERLGTNSITFAYEVFGAVDGSLRSRVRLVHAFVSVDGFKKISLPSELTEALVRVGVLEEGS